MKKFRLSAEAAGDLTEIFDYIAEDSGSLRELFQLVMDVCPDTLRRSDANSPPGIG